MQVMNTPGLLAAALQATLTCDAISLRFQLPPHGSPPPQPLAMDSMAAGVPCTPALVTTSVWVVSLLRQLAQKHGNPLLSLVGVGAVSTQPVAAFAADDAQRYKLLQSQQPLLGTIPQVRPSVFPVRVSPLRSCASRSPCHSPTCHPSPPSLPAPRCTAARQRFLLYQTPRPASVHGSQI